MTMPKNNNIYKIEICVYGDPGPCQEISGTKQQLANQMQLAQTLKLTPYFILLYQDTAITTLTVKFGSVSYAITMISPTARQTVYFKNEGKHYSTKFEIASSSPAQPDKMYEFGELETRFFSKTNGVAFCRMNGYNYQFED